MKVDTKTLNAGNCSLYLKMTAYLSGKNLKKSEYNRVCEDIYLMLVGAQERGESPESLFPEGYQKFLDDVADNCEKENKLVVFFNGLFAALAIIAAVICVEAIFAAVWADEGEWVRGVTMRVGVDAFIGAFIAAGVGVGCSVLNNKFTFRKFIYKKKLGYYFYLLLLLVAAIGTEIVLCAVLRFTDRIEFLTVNWVAIAAPCAAAAIAIKVGQILFSKFAGAKK